MTQNRSNLCFAAFTTASGTLFEYNTIKRNYHSYFNFGVEQRSEAKRQQPHNHTPRGCELRTERCLSTTHAAAKADAAAAPAARPASDAGVATSAAVAVALADPKSCCCQCLLLLLYLLLLLLQPNCAREHSDHNKWEPQCL